MNDDRLNESAAAITGAARGRVQGVNFRASMQMEASRLGVTGWVQNMPDGSVAFYAEGSRSSLDGLLAWCRIGPMFARVDHLEFEDRSLAQLRSFEILR